MVDREEEVYMFDEESDRQIERKRGGKRRYFMMLPYLLPNIVFAYFFYKYAFKYPDNTACWANGTENFATAFQE